jgi:hypothetical protein
VAFHFKHVVERSLNSAQHGFKQAVRMDFGQREAASIVRRINDRDFRGIRAENASELASLKFANSQQLERI